MAQASKFWDRHAAGYAKRPVSDEEAYQKKLEITRGYLKPDMELLEFGCGTGSTAIVQAPYVKHYQAIDISPKMLEIAQGKADAAGIKNITFDVSGIEEFDAPDESFDVVMGHSILHLLEDKDAAMAKVHRLLKPGGVFVTSTACIKDIMPLFGAIAPIGKFFGLLPHLDNFTVGQLEDSFKAAGFTIDHQWQPSKKAGVFIVAKKA